MLNENSSFKSWDNIKKLTKNKINILNNCSLKNSIKYFLINIKDEYLKEHHNLRINCYFSKVMIRDDINKYIYNTLTSKNETPTSRVKWTTLYSNRN